MRPSDINLCRRKRPLMHETTGARLHPSVTPIRANSAPKHGRLRAPQNVDQAFGKARKQRQPTRATGWKAPNRSTSLKVAGNPSPTSKRS